MTPSEAAAAPPAACGAPDAGTGGQYEAQLPLQVEAGPVSFANRYRVRTGASTRICPSPVSLRVVTTVDDGDGLTAGRFAAEWPAVSPSTTASARSARRRRRHRAVS